jgi:hypothetical protein
MKKLFVMAFKDLNMSQAIKITRLLSRGIMRFTPPLCDYSHSPSMWGLQFSSASQLGALMKIKSFGLSSKLKKKEQDPCF